MNCHQPLLKRGLSVHSGFILKYFLQVLLKDAAARDRKPIPERQRVFKRHAHKRRTFIAPFFSTGKVAVRMRKVVYFCVYPM
jgi:hypothetical protein